MLHYPHLKIPEERFAWIYPLSTELEPNADIYWWESQQQDTKDTWGARLEGKELQKYGEWEELEQLCLPMLKQYPRANCFFFFLLDAYMMKGDLEYAGQLNEKRKHWMISFPYKVIGKDWALAGVDREMNTLRPYGYTYYRSMTDWIGAMRTIQFYEIDIKKRISEGYVFKARPKIHRQ